MDYREILEISKNKLASTYPNVIEDIEYLIGIGSTGGEIITAVGNYLIKLETRNNEAYKIIEKEKRYIWKSSKRC
jgi:hypothetical protein